MLWRVLAQRSESKHERMCSIQARITWAHGTQHSDSSVSPHSNMLWWRWSKALILRKEKNHSYIHVLVLINRTGEMVRTVPWDQCDRAMRGPRQLQGGYIVETLGTLSGPLGLHPMWTQTGGRGGQLKPGQATLQLRQVGRMVPEDRRQTCRQRILPSKCSNVTTVHTTKHTVYLLFCVNFRAANSGIGQSTSPNSSPVATVAKWSRM